MQINKFWKPLFGVIIIAALICCKEKKSISQTKTVEQSLLDSIYVNCPETKNKPLTIYCMDGDCPSCISKAKILEIQHQKQSIDKKLVLLTITQNKNVLDYNFKLSGISSCRLIVRIEQLIEAIPLHSVTSIDPKGNMYKQILHY